MHVTQVRVRYGETDQMGVVYHAEYLAYCEIGRTELIRTLGLPYAEMERQGVLLAVADASLRFHAPARYDDLLDIETRLTDVRSRGVSFEYLIRNAATGARLVSARTDLVAIDPGNRLTAIPPALRERLAMGLDSIR
ncbi:MAG: acyl-CoA thioesterase [Gemmatimonadaceae bacterium]|nr:acyl-CoA thioesterase [Gemmatimonadaceae bacterium]